MRVVAYVPDLIDRSRISTIQSGTEFVDDLAKLADAAQGADVVLLDLSRKGAVQAIAGVPCARIVGFANHTAKDTFEDARRAGAVVMARSEFFIRIEELIFDKES